MKNNVASLLVFIIISMLIASCVNAQEFDQAYDEQGQDSLQIPVANSYSTAYLDILRNTENDARFLEALRSGSGDDLMLGNVIFADIVGDSNPEMIYSTIVNESGEAALNVMEELYYTKKAVVHVVTYDFDSQQAYDILDFDALGISDQGRFTHFGIWIGDYRIVDGYQNLYYHRGVNVLGTVVHLSEYQYNQSGKRLEETYYVDYGSNPGVVPVDEIDNPLAKRVAMYNSDPGVKLLFDAYGRSDFESLTYDEAVAYLKAISESDSTRNEDELINGYKIAYLNELMNNQWRINNILDYTYQNGETSSVGNCIAFCDITGDDVPELFYLYRDNDDILNYCQIISYQNENLVSIKDNDQGELYMFGAANGSAGSLFRTNYDNHLYFKTGTIGGSYRYDSILEYEVSNNELLVVNSYYMELTYDPLNNGQEKWVFQKNGVDMDERSMIAEFDRITQHISEYIIGNLCFLVYSTDTNFSDNSISMSYDEAITFLSDNSSSNDDLSVDDYELITGSDSEFPDSTSEGQEESESLSPEVDPAIIGNWEYVTTQFDYQFGFYKAGYCFYEDGTGLDVFWNEPFTYTAINGVLELQYKNPEYSPGRMFYEISYRDDYSGIVSNNGFTTLNIEYEGINVNGDHYMHIPEDVFDQALIREGEAESWNDWWIISTDDGESVTIENRSRYFGWEEEPRIVPATINGHPVKKVNYTVIEPGFDFDKVNGIIVEDGIEVIGEKAFSAAQVRYVSLPASVQYIAEDAFYYDEASGYDGSQITLYVPQGSYAEHYAQEHNLNYVYSDVTLQEGQDVQEDGSQEVIEQTEQTELIEPVNDVQNVIASMIGRWYGPAAGGYFDIDASTISDHFYYEGTDSDAVRITVYQYSVENSGSFYTIIGTNIENADDKIILYYKPESPGTLFYDLNNPIMVMTKANESPSNAEVHSPWIDMIGTDPGNTQENEQSFQGNVSTTGNTSDAIYNVTVTAQNNSALRKGPGPGYEEMYRPYAGQMLQINQTVINDTDGVPWGRTTLDGVQGWICLESTVRNEPSVYNQAKDFSFYNNHYTAVVGSSEGVINFRTGPGRSYDSTAEVYNGTSLYVTAVLDNSSDGLVWGQTIYNGISGWISMRQTTITDIDNACKAQYNVIVQNSTNIGLRRGPGMEYDLLNGNIPNGTSLYITETMINSFDGRPWGKTNINGIDGWVSLNWTVRASYTPDYIPEMDDPYQGDSSNDLNMESITEQARDVL